MHEFIGIEYYNNVNSIDELARYRMVLNDFSGADYAEFHGLKTAPHTILSLKPA